MGKYFYILLAAFFISSCSTYQKALKSEDTKLKYEVAEQMYEKGKYTKAVRLFEQLTPTHRGKPQAEKMFYMYAQSLYKTKQYYLSGYQFESFTGGYPRSEKLEEASFLAAKSYYFLSPEYSLDQTDTYKAMDKLQAFINDYPNSTYMPEANQIVKELTEKLDKKAFEIAKQYNTIGEYMSASGGSYTTAIIALDNFLIENPGTVYKEDALFLKFDSAYKLAVNSIPSKMEERLNAAKGHYGALIKFRPDTKYKKEADEMLLTIEKELKNFSK